LKIIYPNVTSKACIKNIFGKFMKTKIVSFGDSFVFGSELKNNNTGNKSWIGQAAKNLGVDYETLAVPGCGNENISRQILTYFSNNPGNNVFAIINWTWVARWDFYVPGKETWTTHETSERGKSLISTKCFFNIGGACANGAAHANSLNFFKTISFKI
jgi:hypothetical protein